MQRAGLAGRYELVHHNLWREFIMYFYYYCTHFSPKDEKQQKKSGSSKSVANEE